MFLVHDGHYSSTAAVCVVATEAQAQQICDQANAAERARRNAEAVRQGYPHFVSDEPLDETWYEPITVFGAGEPLPTMDALWVSNGSDEWQLPLWSNDPDTLRRDLAADTPEQARANIRAHRANTETEGTPS